MRINEIITNKKKIYYKIIIILSFIISWASIGTSNSDLFILTTNEDVTLKSVINFFRITLNLFCFPMLCFFFFLNFSKYKENKISPYLAFLIPLFCFLSQIPGLFYTSNSLWNFLYILSAINILIILNLIILNFENEEIYLIIFLTFILLSVVFFNSAINDLYKFFSDYNRLFYGAINYFFSDGGIRSSGVSRIGLILLITYSIFFKRIFKSKILRTIPLVFFTSCIFLYESRAIIGITFIFLIFNYLIREKYTLINLLKYLLIYFVLPALLILSLITINSSNLFKCKNTQCEKNVQSLDQDLASPIKLLQERSRFIKHQSNPTGFTGRIEDWKKIINKFDYKNNLFFGYGAQGDRYLINQSASNGLVYTFVSSGITGVTFFLILTLTSGMQLLKYLFFSRKKELISYFSFSIMIVFFIRSIVESSYSVFGIDLILFYMGLILMQRFKVLK